MAGYSDIYGDQYESETGATQVIFGVPFLSSPLFPQGSMSGPLIGELFTSTSTFLSGELTADYALDGVLFQSNPVFPLAELTFGLGGVLFQSSTIFPQGAVSGGEVTVQGVLFQSIPIFPIGLLVEERTLGGVLFVSTATFRPGYITSFYTSPVTLPAGGVISDRNRKGTIRR